jgi:Rod binding domain-containing protein
MKVSGFPSQTDPKKASFNQASSSSSAPQANGSSTQAEKVAAEFEALFLDLMLQSMRKTAAPEDESNAQSIYKSMLDSEYARNMSASSNFGIKELILNWMQKSSTQSSSPESTLEASPEPIAPASPSSPAHLKPAQTESTQKALEQPMSSRLATEIYALQLKALGR